MTTFWFFIIALCDLFIYLGWLILGKVTVTSRVANDCGPVTVLTPRERYISTPGSKFPTLYE